MKQDAFSIDKVQGNNMMASGRFGNHGDLPRVDSNLSHSTTPAWGQGGSTVYVNRVDDSFGDSFVSSQNPLGQSGREHA